MVINLSSKVPVSSHCEASTLRQEKITKAKKSPCSEGSSLQLHHSGLHQVQSLQEAEPA